MNRVKRIAHRGWLNKATLIFTFGHYPASLLVRGKLCIGAITMTLPSMATAMRLPSMTIDIEDCP